MPAPDAHGPLAVLARSWLGAVLARALVGRALAAAVTVVPALVGLLVVVVCLAVALSALVLGAVVARAVPAAGAQAASDGAALIAAAGTENSVRRYDATVTLDEQGVATVVLDLDVDFGTRPDRGPYLTYVVKQRYDDTLDRVYRVSDVQASSSTGAADEVHLEEEGGWVEIRIGEEDRQDLTGVHSYRVTYQVEGWVNPAGAFDAEQDELYLDVIGERWEVPLEDVRVTVAGPADVVDARCLTIDDECAADASGAVARFRQDGLAAGDPLTVAVAWPAGTFIGAEPILQDRWSAGRAFAVTPWTAGAAALVGLLGAAWLARRVRTQGRDERFRGLTAGAGTGAAGASGAATTPGGTAHGGTAHGGTAHGGTVAPGAGTAATGAALGEQQLSADVRRTPPPDLRPGQLGTLVDETADPHDVTATLVDLAVRGYLVIGPVTGGRTAVGADSAAGAGPGSPSGAGPGGPSGAADDPDAPISTDGADWQLARTDKAAGDLLPFEATLLRHVFDDRDTVTLSQLRTTFADAMSSVQDQLYADVTARGWFRGNPSDARASWAAHGALLLTGGVVLTVALAVWTSWALVGAVVVVLGLAMLVMTGAAPARTAEGTAVLAETEAFRRYLASADTEELLRQGEDAFSRYLPFAIAFGLTERWAEGIADVAAQGRAVPSLTWYAGYHPALWSGGAFGRELVEFTHVADAAIAAPSPGATGSSGVSAGVAGGGVGGGGGGTW